LPVSSTSSMTLRTTCSCFSAAACDGGGRSGAGWCRSRKSPYSFRMRVTRSVPARRRARALHHCTARLQSWPYLNVLSDACESVQVTRPRYFTRLADKQTVRRMCRACAACSLTRSARLVCGSRTPPFGRASPTCEPLGDVQRRRRRRRRAGHLEQLAQHGVHARGHRARHLGARAPGRRRARLRIRPLARPSLPCKVEPEFTPSCSTVCCGNAGRSGAGPALGSARETWHCSELNYHTVTAGGRGSAVSAHQHAVPAGNGAPGR